MKIKEIEFKETVESCLNKDDYYKDKKNVEMNIVKYLLITIFNEIKR